MDGPDPSRAGELAESLRVLQQERQRLEELRSAYRIVERSRFARLRAAYQEIRAALGLRTQRSLLFPSVLSPSAEPVIVPPRQTDERSSELLRELELDRLNLLEKVRLQRTQGEREDGYDAWRKRNMLRPTDFIRALQVAPSLRMQPLISVVMTTFETPEEFLRDALDSVREQAYPNWELCIADDASQAPHVRQILDEYAAIDPRIKVLYRKENGHIATAGNSALALATGEFVGFLDHDDLLTRDALLEVVLAINRFPDVDMLYSDEDKLDELGNFCEPHFKPDWSPDSFLSRMYTCHFGVYRRSLVESLGGFRAEFTGSQDYDLVLRLTERTERIHHIPRVLYHWRKHRGSASGIADAKPYSSRAAELAIAEALDRRGEPGTVSERSDCRGVYLVRYEIRQRGRVSVVIPTRDHGEDVDRCLSSLFSSAGYEDLEVLLIDNGSTDRSSLAVFERWAKREPRLKVERFDVPFNFSRINNFAASKASGDYLLFLNNDTEAKTPGWVSSMVEQAQRPSIGAVGALLLYPDDTVQHAGVVVGIGGVAGHSHKYLPVHANGYNNMLKAINNWSAVTAACLMTRRQVFDEVGGFDEDLAVAFNDVDFCLKICEAGYRIVALPHVQLYHFESKSRGLETTPEKQARFAQEVRLMQERWNTRERLDPYYNPNLTQDHEDYSPRVTAEPLLVATSVREVRE